MTTSTVDTTIPQDGVTPAKSDFRDNFTRIKNELDTLFRLTSTPYKAASSGIDATSI